MLSRDELAGIRSRVEQAHEMVSPLCKPRGTPGAREWVMSIPARQDYDPDLVIGDALTGADKLLAHIDALEAELAAAERVVDAARKLKHPTSVYHWERFYNALDAYDAQGEHVTPFESDAG